MKRPKPLAGPLQASQVAQETQKRSAYSSLYTISFSLLTQSTDLEHMGTPGTRSAELRAPRRFARVSRRRRWGQCVGSPLGQPVERIDLQTIGQTRRLRRAGDQEPPVRTSMSVSLYRVGNHEVLSGR